MAKIDGGLITLGVGTLRVLLLFYVLGPPFTGEATSLDDLDYLKTGVVYFNLHADALFRAWNRELHYTPAPSGSSSGKSLPQCLHTIAAALTSSAQCGQVRLIF